MNIKSCIAAVAALALTTSLAPAFAATGSAPAAQASPAQVFGKLISGQEEEIVAVAEAMPADKYDFAPTNGEFKTVRTFGQQLTHIAQAQYYFFGGFGTKPTFDPKSLEQTHQQRRNRESRQRFLCLCPPGNRHHDTGKRIRGNRGTGRDQHPGHHYRLLHRPHGKPLRADGRIPAYERNHPARQPQIAVFQV